MFAAANQRFYTSLVESTTPIIAVIDGPIHSTVLEIVMACHRRVATKRSTFQFFRLNSLAPFLGTTQRLPRILGLEYLCSIIALI